MRISSLIPIVCSLALVGCGETFVAPTPEPARVRVVNTVFQTTDASNSLPSAQPRAIDVLFDSSDSRGVLGVAPVSATGEGDGQAYLDVGIGLHSWIARLSAPATPNTSLYSNTANPRGEFLPKMYFTPNTYYTLIVAGVAPTAGRPESGAFFQQDFFVSTPIMDDHSRPPVANGKRQARFRMVNASPFGPGGAVGGQTLYGYLTPGSDLPTAQGLVMLASTVSAPFRAQSDYVNVTSGDYVFTLASLSGTTRTILAQQRVTFAPGAVHTFLVQNTAHATVPSSANHRLTVLLDVQHD